VEHGLGTTSETAVNPVANRICGADQRAIGEVYRTAFFLSSLRGFDEYNALFKGDVTFPSLPATVTRVFQYQDPLQSGVAPWSPGCNHHKSPGCPAREAQSGYTAGSGALVHTRFHLTTFRCGLMRSPIKGGIQ
jgi:hypothetical protein